MTIKESSNERESVCVIWEKGIWEAGKRRTAQSEIGWMRCDRVLCSDGRESGAN